MRKLTAITAVLLIAFATLASAEREFSFKSQDSFDGDKISFLKLDIARGDIEIIKSKSNEIIIDYKNVVFADDKDDAADINDDCTYTAEVDGDKLMITIDVPRYTQRKSVFKRLLSGDWDDKINVYLRVQVPDGKDIELKSSSADLEVSDLNLNLDVWGSSSDIKIKNTSGNLRCDLSSGDVDIGHHKGDVYIKGNSSDLDFETIDGNVDARTSSGDGRFIGVTGKVSIYSSSGDYKLYDIGGDLDIRTSSGDIYGNGLSGSIIAESSSGDIRLSEMTSTDGDFDVDSNSGDVILEITDDFAGRISLKSSSGTIKSGLSGNIDYLTDSRVRGDVGNGSGNLKVTTSSGDIRISGF